MFKRVSRRWDQWLEEHQAQFQDLKTMGIMFKRSSLSVVGAIIIALLVIVAAIGPSLAPFDPYKQELKTRLEPPSPYLTPIVITLLCSLVIGISNAYILSKHNYSLPKEGRQRKIVIVLILLMAIFAGITILQIRTATSQGEHIFGIDHLGRDIFSRVLHGARISLKVAIIATAVASVVGVVVGIVSGYLGGKIDDLLMRITDMFLAFPALILAMAVSASLGRGINNVMIAMAVVIWPRYARLARGEALVHKQKEYIEAIRALGASSKRIIFLHLLPLCISPIIVQMTLNMGGVILTAAGLGFIGFGAQPPSPEWGLMVAEGRTRIQFQWWISTFPGLAILIVVLGFNLLGDGIRDILDPKLRR
ncbi:MAG: ABC transporter permease [Candidatus Heimdallarchaeota archaeon]